MSCTRARRASALPRRRRRDARARAAARRRRSRRTAAASSRSATRTRVARALRAAGAADFDDVDLAGALRSLPGFIDTHLHPIGSLYFDLHADLRGVASIAELQDALRAAAARLPARTSGWSGSSSQDEDLAERRLPTRARARRRVRRPAGRGDRARRPQRRRATARALAAAGHRRGHAAIRRAAASSATRDGTPLGPLLRGGRAALLGAVPSPSLERLREIARRAFARLAAHGITVGGRDPADRRRRDRPARPAASSRSRCSSCSSDVPFSTYAILVGRSVDAAVAARGDAAARPRRRAARRRLQDLRRRHLRQLHRVHARAVLRPARRARHDDARRGRDPRAHARRARGRAADLRARDRRRRGRALRRRSTSGCSPRRRAPTTATASSTRRSCRPR